MTNVSAILMYCNFGNRRIFSTADDFIITSYHILRPVRTD